MSVCEWKRAHCLQLSVLCLFFFFFFSSLMSGGLFFLFVCLICSVQKLSEFFSSDEIGEEQEPRAMLSSVSNNHNQNRYQAVVSACAHTHFCVCLLSTRFYSCCLPWWCIQAVSLCSEFGFLSPSYCIPVNITFCPFVSRA